MLKASNAIELKEAFEFGIKNRQVSYTDANDNSSRSHLIFLFQTKNGDDEYGEYGLCTCVDLAGTETN